jgi:hypothetical protein
MKDEPSGEAVSGGAAMGDADNGEGGTDGANVASAHTGGDSSGVEDYSAED